MREKYSNQILRIDGKNSFLEVLNNAFPINNVQINFCQYDEKTNLQKLKLPIYIGIGDALVLTNDIMCGNFQKKIMFAKKSNVWEKQKITPYTSYFIHLGGINENNIKSKFADFQKQFPWVIDGKGISRQLKIQTGNKYPFVFRAEYGLGTSNSTGLIIPDGRALSAITIPVTNDKFMEFACVLNAHIKAYINHFYNKFGDKMFANEKCKLFVPK